MWDLLFLLYGFLGGIIGGMGMGGGTLLIPLLTLFGGLSQHLAQSLNLLVFIPMAIVALIIHFKHKLVDYKKAIFVILPAILGALTGSFLSNNLDENLLSLCFGIFLIALGFFQLFSIFFMKK